MMRRRSESIRKPIAIACLLAALGGFVGGAGAEEPAAAPLPTSVLADLVSDDVGLCIETDGLAEHVARFADGPLYQRLTHFPPLARWVGENGPKIALAHGEFQKRFGASPLDVWAGILGGRALFAVWPPAGESENGPALLLVEANDGELLDQVLDKLVTLQRDAGKLQKTWTLTHGGRQATVHRFGSDENGEQLYLTSVGKLGIAANNEALVRDTLALISREGAMRGPLSELPGYVTASGRLSPQTAIRLFVNPRPWDAGLLADFQRKAPESDDARFQKALIETWRATEYVIAGLQFDSDATLEGFAAWNASALPGQIREATESAGGRAVLVDHVPGDALAAVAGRVDFGRLAWRFGLLGPQLKKTAGGDAIPAAPPEWLLLGSLAQGVGPNFGAYLAVRPAGDAGDAGALESPLPLDWVAGLETRPLEPGDARPSLARLAEPLLHSTLAAAVAATNAQSTSATANLETRDVGGVSMTSVSGLAGPHGRPFSAAYAVVNDQFWAASSPHAIRRALELPPERSLGRHPQLGRLKDPSQLVYLNLKGIRELLQSSPAVVDFLAARNGLDREAARRSGRELLALGQLADTATAAVRRDETGAAACLHLAVEKPAAE